MLTQAGLSEPAQTQRHETASTPELQKVLDDLEEQHVQTQQQVLEDANDETHECRR